MKYLCTISYRDAPAKYAMNNEIVEDIGPPGNNGERWIRVIGTGEELRAYASELWPIDDDMAQLIMDWRQGAWLTRSEV